MATSGGPNIVTEGLVFGYDTGYPIADTAQSLRFNKGEPTENLVGNSTFIGTSGTQTQGVSPANWVFSGESESTGFRFYNSNTSPIPLKFPNEGAVVTTGPGDNSNRRIYFRREDLLGNTTYSISCWMYFSRAFSNAWSKFQYDSSNTNVFSGYFDNFSTYASTYGYGLDEWFLWKGTFTTAATTEKSYWGPVISRTADVLVGMQRMQIEVKDYPTPFIQGTRSVSGSLIDLTRTTDIDLSNVSFDSNAHITFDGTDDSIPIPSVTLGNGNWTVEFVANAHSSGYHMMSNSSGGPVSNAMGVYGNKLYYRNYNGAWQAISSNTTVNYNEIYHLVYVNRAGDFDSDGTMDMYINGEKDSNSGTNSYTTNGGPVNAIGRSWAGYFDGEIYICKRYTTGLSDEEVKQNYNALKNRFNI